MNRARVDKKDVLAAARETHGLERMDQIKYAVLETSGGISIVPFDDLAALRVNTKAPRLIHGINNFNLIKHPVPRVT